MKRFTILIVLLLIACSPVYGAAYDNAYNIDAAISYAEKYAYGTNGKYIRYGSDCTNFVSQCIADPDEGGGIAAEGNFRYRGGVDYDHPWTVAEDLFRYLTGKGYKYDFYPSAAYIPHVSIHVGDLIFFDWNESDSDGITHVVIVVGFTVSGVPCYAGHTENRWMEPLHVNTVLTGSTSMYEYLSYESWDMYVVHMTDTDGFKEVTKNYIGKTVTIKSLETGKYLSSNTDDSTANTDVIANRDAADSWEQFDVIAGDYGAVGFKAHGNSNFLSTRRDVSKEYAPIRACAQTYQQWEAFRIFEKDGVQYIQSQCTGKWLQASVSESDNPIKAAASAASTWERFHLEAISSGSGASGVSTGGTTSAVSPTGGNASASRGASPGGAALRGTVSRRYQGSNYNEGWYEGEWSNGKPNGYGKITYDDFEDGKYYSLSVDNSEYKALYYEGGFQDGTRYGTGKVVYEEGWREEGTYYGTWTAGKKVFEGRIYHKDGVHYLEGYLTAKSTEVGNWTWFTDSWKEVQQTTPQNSQRPLQQQTQQTTQQPAQQKPTTYTISYNANGGRGAPATQTKTQGISLHLSTVSPTREDYTFLGWSLGGAAMSPAYFPGSVFDRDADTVLYAVWEEFERPIQAEPVAEQQSAAFARSIPSAWAREAVARAYDMELLSDYMLEDYAMTTTRLDFVRLAFNAIEEKNGWMQQILYKKGLVADMDLGPSVPFVDVPEGGTHDDGYDQYRVAALSALGIVNGVGDGKFEPNRAITREEAAVLLNRVHSFLEWGEVRYYTYRNSTDQLYGDIGEISDWAFYDVYNMRSIDVMGGVGDNRFAPKGRYTIEQSIVTFMRLLDY